MMSKPAKEIPPSITVLNVHALRFWRFFGLHLSRQPLFSWFIRFRFSVLWTELSREEPLVLCPFWNFRLQLLPRTCFGRHFGSYLTKRPNLVSLAKISLIRVRVTSNRIFFVLPYLPILVTCAFNNPIASSSFTKVLTRRCVKGVTPNSPQSSP